MILEVPQSALFSKKINQNDRKMYQSRHLKRLMDAMERNVFDGPAENTRESIVMAARSLALADWESACLCTSAKAWESLPSFNQGTRDMIINRISKNRPFVLSSSVTLLPSNLLALNTCLKLLSFQFHLS